MSTYTDMAAAELRANGGKKCCPQCNRMLPADQLRRLRNKRGVSTRCIHCISKARAHLAARKVRS